MRGTWDPVAGEGVDLCPSPPNPYPFSSPPPFAIAQPMYMQAALSPLPFSLLFIGPAGLLCHVSSSSPWTGRGPFRATAGHHRPDPGWQQGAGGVGGGRRRGGVTSVWLLFSWRGSGSNGQMVFFWGWARGQTSGSASLPMSVFTHH